MIYSIFPSSDATIYEFSSSMNTGIDEIIELVKQYKSGSASQNSRILIKFDMSSVSASISAGDITAPEYALRLFTTEEKGIPSDFTLDVHPVSQSWDNGVGRQKHFPSTTVGVSWENRTTVSWRTGSYASNTTGSNTSTSGGGTWHTLVSESVEGYPSASMDVTAVNYGDNFYLTASNGDIYTFAYSSSVSSSYSGQASASMIITRMNELATFIVSGSQSGSFIVTDIPVPNDVSSARTYYFHGSASVDTVATSSATVNITGIDDGEEFILSGSVNAKFIASDTPVPADITSAGIYYFNGSGSATTASLIDRVASMSVEIGSLSQFSASTAGTPATTMSIFSTDNGRYVNTYTFQAGTTVTEFASGSTNNLQNQMISMSNKINNISLGVSSSVADVTMSLYSTEHILAANSYVFTSGSTSVTFEGNISTSSISVLDDDITNKKYYFISGSSLAESVGVLGSTITGSTSLIDVTVSASVLQMTSSLLGVQGTQFYFQSGSTSVQFQGSSSMVNVSSSVSQSYSFETSDLNTNVTPIVNLWMSSSLINEGFIVKRQDSDEQSNVALGSIQYFSKETNTIYVPKLDIKWDDQVFMTGSLEPLLDKDIVIYLENLQRDYKEDSKAHVRINGRAKHPQRTFATSSRFQSTQYLPTSTYYSVVDSITNETIIPFDDNYTKVSCDSNGNYFNLWMNGLMTHRYYKFIFKVVRTGQEQYFDDGYYFKIIR